MTRADAQFKIRIPADLRDRVGAAAAENDRSVNREIIHTLEAAYPSPKSDDVKAFMLEALKAVADLCSDDSERSMEADGWTALDMVNEAISRATQS